MLKQLRLLKQTRIFQPPLRWELTTFRLIIAKNLPSIYDRIKLVYPVFAVALVT